MLSEDIHGVQTYTFRQHITVKGKNERQYAMGTVIQRATAARPFCERTGFLPGVNLSEQ